MKKNSLIYIAGHNGLVGSSIQRALAARGYNNIITRSSAELDLRRQADVEGFFNKEKPEYVYLAAARVGGIIANNTYKAEFIYDNMMIAINIINSSYNCGVKKMLNLGSSCIYPKFAPQPMKEDLLLTGTIEPTNEPYSIAKISAIKLCRYYNEQYGTNFISATPTNLFGMKDNFNLETSHLLPALIRKFHLAKLMHDRDVSLIRRDILKWPIGFGMDEKARSGGDDVLRDVLSKIGITGEQVLIWGTGEPFREFLYVDDMADAAIFLMEKYDYKDIGEFINIGGGSDMKIKDMAVIVKEIIGFRGDIKHDTTKPDGAPRKLLDDSKIKSLGWKQKTSFEEGVKKQYEWYLSELNG